jgi:peptidyl-prolyl cis-trans isomerase C
MTLDELKAKLKENGMDYDKWKEGMNFDKRIAFKKLMQPKFDADINVSEKDARTYYDNNKQRFDVPEQVRASHILVKIPNDANDPNAAKAAAKAKAEDILKQVKAGGDFAELAKKNSDCPSAQNGGDLNFFQRDRMVKPFADAAFGMKVGQTSDLVETQFGYHIIKVTDHKDANTVSFEQVKKELIDDLSRDKQEEITKNYIESLKKSANIVYPAGSQEIAPRPATVRQPKMAPSPAPAKAAGPNQTK